MLSISFTVYQAYLIFLVRSEIVDIRLQQYQDRNGYTPTSTTNTQVNLNITNTQTNEQNNSRSNTVELPPKQTVDTKVEIVDEKKAEVKFDRVSKGAIARLSDKYKDPSADEKKAEVKFDGVSRGAIAALSDKYKVTNAENKSSKTDTAKVSDTSSDKNIAVKTSEEAIPSTSKDVKQEAIKSDDSKEIKTISEDKENDASKNIPVPKKRGLFRRSKS